MVTLVVIGRVRIKMHLMVRSTKKIKQLAVAIMAMLSLSISSVAACACSHHALPEPEKSCHGPAHRKSNSDVRVPAYDQNCSCFPAATERSVKAENFKLKKQADGHRSAATLAPISFILVRRTSGSKLVASFYDQLLHFSPFSRGPPLE